MPSAATIGNTPQSGKANRESAPQVAPNPFTRASAEHIEPFFDRDFGAIAAAATAVNGIDVPSFGYLRGIWLQVDVTGGAGVAAVAVADAPWSALQSIQLTDVQGAPIFGPLDGFVASMAMMLDQHHKVDPLAGPIHLNVQTNGNFNFLLYIPVESGPRDGLGALPNQNAGQTYKLAFNVGGLANIYSTNPSTIPTSLRVRAWSDTWAQPDPADVLGRPNVDVPPAAGTTQFWTRQVFNLAAAGNQTFRVARVGNLIRFLMCVVRNTSGVRTTSIFPDPVQLQYDGRILHNVPRGILQHLGYSRQASFTLGGGDGLGSRSGVLVFSFGHDLDGKYGYEMRDLWLPTTQATRLDIVGSFGAAGTLEVVTCDIAPAGDVYLG